MALESATTINQLREEFPTGLDPKNQGDDHLRLIKGALKRTFPNIAGVVTASHEQLNGLFGAGVTNTPGLIMMWGYELATVPSGWKVCNGVGTLRDGRAVPDLRNRFIVAAGGTYAPAAVGGAATHTHELSISETTLTIDQIPSHNHGFRSMNTPTTELRPGIGGAELATAAGANNYGYEYGRIQHVGGGKPHGHGGSAKVADNLPPYFALLYIIKD